MRAEITSTGCLKVIGENETERFALLRWAEDYFRQQDDNTAGFASLMICAGQAQTAIRLEKDT